ncbi:MAG: hypothetical protein V4437_00075 [Patescibacteria group bacterium]
MSKEKGLTPAEKFTARWNRPKGMSIKDARRAAKGLPPGPALIKEKPVFLNTYIRPPGWGM